MRKQLILAVLLSVPTAHAKTLQASSCNVPDIQQQINNAAPGDTVNIPAGVCWWGDNSVKLTKAITLNGAGVNQTLISGNSPGKIWQPFTVTEQTTGVIHIRNMTFSVWTIGGGALVWPVRSMSVSVAPAPSMNISISHSRERGTWQ